MTFDYSIEKRQPLLDEELRNLRSNVNLIQQKLQLAAIGSRTTRQEVAEVFHQQAAHVGEAAPLQSLLAQNDDAQFQLHSYRSQLALCQNEHQQLSSTNAELYQQINEIRSKDALDRQNGQQLSAERSENGRAAQQISAEIDQLVEKQKQFSALLRQEVHKGEAAKATSFERIARAEAQNGALREKNEQLKTAFGGLDQTDVRSASKALDEANQIVAGLARQIDQLNDEIRFGKQSFTKAQQCLEAQIATQSGARLAGSKRICEQAKMSLYTPGKK